MPQPRHAISHPVAEPGRDRRAHGSGRGGSSPRVRCWRLRVPQPRRHRTDRSGPPRCSRPRRARNPVGRKSRAADGISQCDLRIAADRLVAIRDGKIRLAPCQVQLSAKHVGDGGLRARADGRLQIAQALFKVLRAVGPPAQRDPAIAIGRGGRLAALFARRDDGRAGLDYLIGQSNVTARAQLHGRG